MTVRQVVYYGQVDSQMDSFGIHWILSAIGRNVILSKLSERQRKPEQQRLVG